MLQYDFTKTMQFDGNVILMTKWHVYWIEQLIKSSKYCKLKYFRLGISSFMHILRSYTV